MPVDPALQPVLAQLAQAPAAASLEEMRAAVIANALRSPRRPVTLGEVRDLTLPGPDGPLPARLYHPAGTAPAQGWPLRGFSWSADGAERRRSFRRFPRVRAHTRRSAG